MTTLNPELRRQVIALYKGISRLAEHPNPTREAG